MDPLIIVDAIAAVMAHEEKELYKPATSALALILETAERIYCSRDAVCPYSLSSRIFLPLFTALILQMADIFALARSAICRLFLYEE